jgi:hypothetical protein
VVRYVVAKVPYKLGDRTKSKKIAFSVFVYLGEYACFMPLHKIPLEELRIACRQRLETCEMWLRRLIHEELSRKFGSTYFREGIYNSNALFSSKIRKHAAERMNREPNRYDSEIDTLLMDHIVDTVCKSDLFADFFRPALKGAFPHGNEEARTFLSRLVPVRNALSHANPISVRDAERVLCYCGDVIESIKEFYESRNMEQEYNTPRFTRFADSLGNSKLLSETRSFLSYTDSVALRPGDSIRLEVEVDSSFEPNAYRIDWVVCNIPNDEQGSGTSFQLTIQPQYVSETFCISASLKSMRSWHRYGNFDDSMVIYYKVLPPLK